ncbi:MAG TPA: crossover junction endodeoxyribonuclease RuvC [Alphaproteobacteria bacterium]|nr:crossover junction endodeoxyribonuclease RuvC [Alphaproteobacteria bacterium]
MLGLDPSLSSTGWGVIEVNANRLQYVADGFIPTSPKMPIEERLDIIFNTLSEVIETYQPIEAAIEKTFLNSNPETSLKLSMARGVVILAAGHYHLPLFEFDPTKVKKALVGVGHADKNQVETMVKILLPGCKPKNNDASDALAMAITRSHYRTSVSYK